jgi:hypothetical protein
MPQLGVVKYATLLAFILLSAATTPPPPDLRVAWSDGGKDLEGDAGATVPIGYVIRNVGGRDAFAVVIRITTALGPVAPVRLQPGPNAGASVERQGSVSLAVGMRELCVDVTLQNVALEDPPDPNLADNRVCRAVRVREKK